MPAPLTTEQPVGDARSADCQYRVAEPPADVGSAEVTRLRPSEDGPKSIVTGSSDGSLIGERELVRRTSDRTTLPHP